MDDAGKLERVEIRFSGSGGQGILLAAAIVAEGAAALGKQVVQTQTYGPEARGGASKAEVIISDDDIDYPEVQHPDINLVLSQAAYLKYAADTRPRGLLIYDSGLVEIDAAADRMVAHGLPFTQAATDELGKKVVTNIVSLGAFVALSGVLPADAVEQAVLNRVPARFRDLNEQAFRLGLRLADKVETSAMQDAAARS